MATVDTLQINIETNAEQAKKSLNSLSRTIEKLSGQIVKVANISLAFKRLSASIDGIAYSGGLSTLARDVKSASKNSSAIAQAAQNVAASQGKLADGVEKATGAVDANTKSTKANSDEQKNSAKVTNKAAGGFNKLMKSIGRVAFYRAIRTMLKEITQALHEGLDNIDAWSKAINDPDIINAHEVLNKYNTEWLKVKNTLGAVIAPALEALYPIFEKIADKIIVAGNELAKFMTIVANSEAHDYVGINLDVFKEYSSEIGKVNKQLQKFDELNNLTSQNGIGSNDTNYEDYFKKYDLTEDERIKFNNLKDQLQGIADTMAAIWAVDKITTWGTEVASIFAPTGAAGILSTLAGWAAAGILVGLVIEWVLKSKTGKGINDWLHPLLMGETDWQTKINTNVDKFWEFIFTGGEPEIDFGDTVIGTIAEELTKSAWRLLTPAGLWDTFIRKPLEALDELRNGFNKTKQTADTDLKAINDVWGWLDSAMVKINPEVDTKEIFYFKDAIDSAKARWQELNGLKAQPPHITTDPVTAFNDAIKNVIENWQKLINSDTVDLEAILKLTTEMGLTVGEEDLPDFLTNPQKYAEKITALVEGIQKDFKESIFGGNSLQEILNGQSGFLSKLKTRLQAFLDDFATVGSNVTNAMKGGGVTTTPESLQRGAQKFYVKAFASGGYPTAGDLFLANEAGAEMVGSINGRTAVANNQEITQAIAVACYNAMSQALAENDMNVTLQGDANGLFKVVQKQARQYRQTTGSYAF